MLVYKVFGKKDKLDTNEVKHMTFWGMDGVGSPDTPFAQCRSIKEVFEARRQGLDIVGITAVPFSVPFVAENIKVEKTGARVTVSGAFRLEVNPDKSFRDFILARLGSTAQMTEEQLTKEFHKDVNLNLASVLTHIVNAENVEMLRRHGEEAFDVQELTDKLPGWCRVVGVRLRVDSASGELGPYAENVVKALNADDKKHTEKRESAVAAAGKMVLNRYGILALNAILNPVQAIVKGVGLFILAMLLVRGCNGVIRWIGGDGGPAHAVACKVVFKDGEKSDSSKLEMWLFEQRLSAMIQRISGNRYMSFTYGEEYKLDRDKELERFKSECLEYVRDNRGTLEVVGKHARRDGVKEIFDIGKHSLSLTVRTSADFTPDDCKVVIDGNDNGGLLAKKMQRIFLSKGKKNSEGKVEYKIRVRADQFARFCTHLENDSELKRLKLRFYTDGNVLNIILNASGKPQKYVLDISMLKENRELIASVEKVFRCDFAADTQIVQTYHSEEISRFLREFGGDSDVHCKTVKPEQKGEPLRLVFRINLAKLVPEEYRNKSLEELEKIIADFWNSPDEEMKQYKNVVAECEKCQTDLKPYTLPSAIPLTAESPTVYDELEQKIGGFRERIAKGENDTKVFLKDYVANKFYRSGLSVPRHAMEHEANLKMNLEKYADMLSGPVGIDKLIKTVRERKEYTIGDEINKKAIADYKNNRNGFWQNVETMNKLLNDQKKRVEVMQGFANNLKGVRALPAAQLTEVRRWFAQTAKDVQDARRQGGELVTYFEQIVDVYDAALGKRFVRTQTGISAQAVAELQTLIEAQEREVAMKLRGRDLPTRLRNLNDDAVSLSESETAVTCIKQLEKLISRIGAVN